LNLRKAFENQRDGLWPAFKIGELALAGIQNQRVGSSWLSKSASGLWPAFKIGELTLAGFHNRQVGSGRLSKALAQLREICYPIGAKDFNSPVLKSFS
jgi:hypothetical protein